jgi:hypothetical protein
MSADMYKVAAQTNLMFESKRGMLTVSQLFQLPLKSQTGFDLDTVARTINAQLKGVTEESFVEDTTADPRKTALTTSLEIVKDVIATKQAENRAAAEKVRKAAERKKLLDVLAAKKDEKLSQASIEELEKKLADLDG